MSKLSKRELFTAYMIVKCSQPCEPASKKEFDLYERTTNKLDKMIAEKGWDEDYHKFIAELNPIQDEVPN